MDSRRTTWHTWDWEPVTIPLQALSLVEKAELVQVRFTLRLRDQRSMWMQDGCRVYMDSYMAFNGSCFMVTWDYFQKPPLGGWPNTRLGDHGTMNAHNHWFLLPYHVWGLTRIEIHWNTIWLRVRSHVTSHYTRGSMTWFRRCLGRAFGNFLLGSHNFMVTALDSCSKWPLLGNLVFGF